MEAGHGKSETEDSLTPCAEVTLSCKVVCVLLEICETKTIRKNVNVYCRHWVVVSSGELDF